MNTQERNAKILQNAENDTLEYAQKLFYKRQTQLDAARTLLEAVQTLVHTTRASANKDKALRGYIDRETARDAVEWEKD